MHNEGALPAAITWTARLMRDNSPPEATFARLFGGWPGLALTRNSISSLPAAENSPSEGVTVMTNLPPDMPSACIKAETWLPS